MSIIYRDFPLFKSDVYLGDCKSLTCDSEGRILYIKYLDDFEAWYKYDENGYLIGYKECCGYKEKSVYDNNGNLLFYENTEGVNIISEYDEDGNVIHFSDGTGYEEWYDYDEFGRITGFRNNERYEEWIEYNNRGQVVHYKNNNGVEELLSQWRDDVNILRRDYASDFTQLLTYDTDTGYISRYLDKPSYTVMRFNEYDKVGNVIHDRWNRNFKSYYRWYYYQYDYLAYSGGDRNARNY